MPTASTSQILGVNECFEPFSSNLYLRRVKAGEFIMANPHLLQDLTDRGLWTPAVRNQLMRDGGSVANIDCIPTRLKELYKTVWEIKMKDIIDMAADRGKFVDQSQSLNLFIADPTVDKLTAMHFYAWKKGLKVRIDAWITLTASWMILYSVSPLASCRFIDWHVLPTNETGGECHSIHCGQDSNRKPRAPVANRR
jgi:ribonucleotide reductase alpha subunit